MLLKIKFVSERNENNDMHLFTQVKVSRDNANILLLENVNPF